MDELIVVDKQDNIIGSIGKEECHNGDGILHRAFSIFIFNNQKQLLIQQRSNLKRLWPLFWSNTCCSHQRLREPLLDITKKRLEEEFGFSCPLKNLYKFQYSAKYNDVGSENEICSVLIGKLNDEIKLNPNPEEVSNFKWVNIKELQEDIKNNPEKYSPWFKIECKELFSNYLDEIEELFT